MNDRLEFLSYDHNLSYERVFHIRLYTSKKRIKNGSMEPFI